MAVQPEELFRPWKEVFRDARHNAGWSQNDAHVQLGIALRTIQEWEAGRTLPSWTHIQICALAFGWGADFLEHIEKLLKPRPDLRHQLPISF
jgi:DNA-binding XRE family transcriptional regulator